MENEELFATELQGVVGAEGVLADEALAAHTTFAIGGPAQWLVLPRNEEQVRDVAALCRAHEVPLRVLGLGSNVLAADAGVRGVVLKLAENFAHVEVQANAGNDACASACSGMGEGKMLDERPGEPAGADGAARLERNANLADVLPANSFCDVRASSTGIGLVVAQAGASNAAVAEAACAAGLSGYEFASGIPGTIGGAAIMNAGAYDGEFRDVAMAVRCLTPEGDIVDVSADEAAWSYRHSMMMDAGYVVLGATLRLTADDPAVIRTRMDDLAQRRADKQPLEMPSAGSTFKRPQGHFAGKLIQDAGLRGYRVGGAQVSTKHTGFVVNAGGATAADVLQLIADVQARVYECSGVRLEPEVRLWE